MNHLPGTVYFAGPLFTQAERRWNLDLAAALRERGFKVVLPQEDAADLVTTQGGFEPSALFSLAADSIRRCSAVLAVLDGPDPDSGTAFECGLAWALEKPIVGIRTDFRLGGDGLSNVNLMLSSACIESISISSLTSPNLETVVEPIAAALSRVLSLRR